jgi:hypothetical protein
MVEHQMMGMTERDAVVVAASPEAEEAEDSVVEVGAVVADELVRSPDEGDPARRT